MAKILVIDDDSELLEMLRLLLENRGGHEAVLSADGTDGLNKALDDPPDLAIVDVMMPAITGYEICRRLRDNPATASMPILILTARGQAVDREAALEAGADDYMAKPAATAELLERVNGLLRGRETAKPTALAEIIALLSLRGGVGVTTVAVNLATILAQGGLGPVCLVDLNSSSGHVALQLRLRPESTWISLVEDEGLDVENLEKSLLQHASGLYVLPAPVVPVVEPAWTRTSVAKMFKVLRDRFAYVVVDMPSVLDGAAMAALDMATVARLVVTAEPSSIRTAVGTMQAVNDWASSFQVIVNHTTSETRLPSEALSRVLRRPIMGSVPFDSKQARALAQGTPLAFSDQSSPLAEAMQALSRKIVRAAKSA